MFLTNLDVLSNHVNWFISNNNAGKIVLDHKVICWLV